MIDKQTYEILKINYELKKLSKNKQFVEIENLAKQLGFSINCYCDFSPENSRQLYLGFSVLNKKGEIIEVEEKNYLCPSTLILEIDRKNRIKFYSSDNEDFLDSLNWVIKELKGIKGFNYKSGN